MGNLAKNTRRCIVCREHADKGELVRFAVINGELIFDNEKKIAGRGMYIHNNESCLNKACRTRVLDKILRKNVAESEYEKLKKYMKG